MKHNGRTMLFRRLMLALGVIVCTVVVGVVAVVVASGGTENLGSGYQAHREFGWEGIELRGFEALDPTSVTDSSGHPVAGYNDTVGTKRFNVSRGSYVIRVCYDTAELHVQVHDLYHTVVDAPGIVRGWLDVCHGLGSRW
jgi:hypothetical protein